MAALKIPRLTFLQPAKRIKNANVQPITLLRYREMLKKIIYWKNFLKCFYFLIQYWTIRTSIPVPLTCKASTLQSELLPPVLYSDCNVSLAQVQPKSGSYTPVLVWSGYEEFVTFWSSTGRRPFYDEPYLLRLTDRKRWPLHAIKKAKVPIIK